MFGELPLRAPVGQDAWRWNTFQGERVLVVATRTVTSTVRVLESLPAVLRDDPRITVVFALDPTSAFAAGVVDLLRAQGCRLMPWEQLPHVSPDLILTATENIDVPEGDCPVLVLPHGVGFQKYVPDSRSDRVRLSGVVQERLLASGRAWLAISHPDQEKQLLAAHPRTSGRTLLIGDPCLDDILESETFRDDYRDALGVGAGQRLVVVSSTWGAGSALGRCPDLPGRLLAALPHDEYRVAVVAHPNVWSVHGAWHLRNLQRAALRAGLLLMPPVHAWRAAVVAADLVVGDHGSVTLYAAASGRPVALAAFGEEAVPGTAVHDLAHSAPRLDPRAALLPQAEAAIAGHRPGRYRYVADRAFQDTGHAVSRLRSAVYGLLRLPEPQSPPPAPVSFPRPERPGGPVTSWVVRTTVTGEPADPLITVVRTPAAVVSGPVDEGEGTASAAHLACTDTEEDPRVRESASVVLRAEPAPTAVTARAWISDTLHRLTGCLLAAAAVRDGCFLVGLRDGRTVEVSTTGRLRDAALPAAAVYACVRAGLRLTDAGAVLRAGQRSEDLLLRLLPYASR